MCTAITLKTKDFYFGRTLDSEFSFVEQVTVTPRNFEFNFRSGIALKNHFAIIGMAYVQNDFPLYYDAMNEAGLAMAGLSFPNNAFYREEIEGKDNIANFELPLWILAQCKTVADARDLINNINVTNTAFSDNLQPTPLHWMIADSDSSIVVESTSDGIAVYDNPVGVMTNNPRFPMHLQRLNDFIHLTPNEPQNTFSDKVNLERYCKGLGAVGLPGDLTSPSRFVRVAFNKCNSVSGDSEEESVSQFFHILGTVEQVNGACYLGNGLYEKTVYTSCCNCTKGIYYYTTYSNRSITAVDMNKCNLDGNTLECFMLENKERIVYQN
ncbi:MAG: choloylglycine hydrolase [Clostridia bacterium]|nr:choloylglycine hydrolase [Clostridia bacterium]